MGSEAAASEPRNRVMANLRYVVEGERVLKDGKEPAAVWRLA